MSESSAAASARARCEVPRLPWLTWSMAGAALALSSVSPVDASLAYLPSSPTLLGLVTCHFVHFSVKHALWDVLTFVLLSSWVEREWGARHAVFVVLAIALVPPAACALTPWVRAYAGLSGLVLGQLALVLAARARVAWRASATARVAGYLTLLGLLLVKQLYELRSGETSLIALNYRGFSTVPAAHLVSVLIGTGVGSKGTIMRTRPKFIRGTFIFLAALALPAAAVIAEPQAHRSSKEKAAKEATTAAVRPFRAEPFANNAATTA